MVQKQITIDYLEYDSITELEEADADLLNRAIEATNSSYAPYSKFNVGAAVRLSNGEIISGSNQENAAYPSGLCAERVTLFYASAKYPDAKLMSIAVVAAKDGKVLPTSTYMCGACRQVLAEYEAKSGSKVRIIIGSATKIQLFNGIESIMPFIFDNLS
ncbi:MAG: cytidine deaminase [Bacteroidales bacterium]